MKTLLIIITSVTLSTGAFAQHRIYYHNYQPRVYVSPFSYGLAYGYPYLSPFYSHPYYGSTRMPYKLSMEIQSIKDDYKVKIREARNDKSLSHSHRRQEIRSLKDERDQEIVNAQRNFVRRRSNSNSSNFQNQYNGQENNSNASDENSIKG